MPVTFLVVFVPACSWFSHKNIKRHNTGISRRITTVMTPLYEQWKKGGAMGKYVKEAIPVVASPYTRGKTWRKQLAKLKLGRGYNCT